MERTDHFSYDEYDRLTRTYVDKSGSVNYPRLKEELPALKDFIDQNATDNELEQAALRFINDPSNVRFDEANLTLYLSKIFDWFAVDFLNYLRVKRGLANPHIAQYVALYLAGSSAKILAQSPATALTIEYLNYDKELND